MGCSGTIDNLLIDRMVSEDSTRGRRNMSMAWIDVKKAYDSVIIIIIIIIIIIFLIKRRGRLFEPGVYSGPDVYLLNAFFSIGH